MTRDPKPRCILCRHGHSVANAQDVIISAPEAGKNPAWGLSPIGKQQADAAGEELLEKLGQFDPSNFVMYTSPFSRCLETAARVGSHLDVHLHDTERFVVTEALRERYFGELEGTSANNYTSVWEADAKDTEYQPPGDGESVNDVAKRMEDFVKSVEARYEGFMVACVSHGDALSILETVLRGGDLKQHRSCGMGNCEIKCIGPDV